VVEIYIYGPLLLLLLLHLLHLLLGVEVDTPSLYNLMDRQGNLHQRMADPNPYRKYNISIEAPRFKCKELRVTDLISPEFDDVEERVTLLEDDVNTLQTKTHNITASAGDTTITGNTNVTMNFNVDPSVAPYYVRYDSSLKCLGIGWTPYANFGLVVAKSIFTNSTMQSTDVVVNTSLIKTDSLNSRVGINKLVPLYTLDVDGNTNISTGSTYKINEVDVLTSTGLGTGVLSSSLTSLGQQTSGVDVATGQGYNVNGASVLTSSTLGSSVVNSSLTSIGRQTLGLDISTGQGYKVNGVEVLNATTLGSGVTGSSLTSLGIQTLGVDINAGQAYKIDGSNILTTTTLGTSVINSSLKSIDKQTLGVDIDAGQAYKVDGTSVLDSTTLGSNVVNSSLTSVGRQTLGMDIATGQAYKINNVNTLTATALGSAVVDSSLTSVGPLTSLAVNGDVTIDTDVLKVNTTTNRVGINNATPSYALDVTGDINTTGRYKRNGKTAGYALCYLYDGVIASTGTILTWTPISILNITQPTTGIFGLPHSGVYKFEVILNLNTTIPSSMYVTLWAGTTSSLADQIVIMSHDNGASSGGSTATTYTYTFMYPTMGFSERLFVKFVATPNINVTLQSGGSPYWSRVNMYELV
jgi:hypothetical protein